MASTDETELWMKAKDSFVFCVSATPSEKGSRRSLLALLKRGKLLRKKGIAGLAGRERIGALSCHELTADRDEFGDADCE